VGRLDSLKVTALIQNRLKSNFAFTVIGMVIPIAIALVTVPLYISYIGAARYGVLSIIWIFLGYFGFLDFGLSRASANALAKLAHASKKEWDGVLLTSLYLNLLLGAIGGIVLYFAGKLLLHYVLPVTDTINAEVETAYPWIASMLPLALLAGVSRGAIESRERFFVINVLDLIGFILGQFIPILCVIIAGPSLAFVIPAAFLARALSVALNLGWIIRVEKLRKFWAFDRSRLKELLGFGAWVSVTNVVSPLLTSIDQFLVGSTIGAVAVAYYAVSMNLVTRGQIFAPALARILFPRFSRLPPDEAMLLAKKAVVALGYGFGAICGPAIIIGGPFMELWMGADFASHATPVIEMLLIGTWINGIALIPYSLLHGQGRPDLVAILHALELLPFIVILWLLVHQFGLTGAALAWTGRVAIDAALLFSAARFSPYPLLRLIPALVLVLASYFIAQTIDVSILWSVIIASSIFLAFIGCAIVFDATARQMVLALRGRLIEAAT
jgi:O-antigen/teichoic acid export membrane protein